MYMSAELIAILTLGVTIVVSMLAGFGWVVRRVDAVDSRLGQRIDRLSDEMTEVKIAIARLEGPPRHLSLSR
ncbi:hypothetical protein [Microbacterium sp. SD291]|uniref:hypothetical protein n=1 Tax=Microbacterium sp. SD291 TaxID=2782007 RepID=UPI001A957044|nr:hypothetical protein [Microbacterium sp. SD291]MBO0980964.1 hypothetical protein [Microbacterium sp. SD291]